MKQLMIALTLILMVGSLSAQDRSSREERRAKIEAEKKAFVTDHAGHTDKEAEAYWPIQAEMDKAIKSVRKEMRSSDDDDEKIDPADMTEDQAKAHYLNKKDSKAKIDAIKKRYEGQYIDILGYKKLLLVNKAERQFKKEVLKKMKGDGPRGEMDREQRKPQQNLDKK